MSDRPDGCICNADQPEKFGHRDFCDEQTQLVTDGGRDEYERGEKRPLDHGVKIRAKLKRGTGTRDQDTLLIEGRGEDADEASAKFAKALDNAESSNWAERLRALQSENGEESE